MGKKLRKKNDARHTIVVKGVELFVVTFMIGDGGGVGISVSSSISSSSTLKQTSMSLCVFGWKYADIYSKRYSRTSYIKRLYDFIEYNASSHVSMTKMVK